MQNLKEIIENITLFHNIYKKRTSNYDYLNRGISKIGINYYIHQFSYNLPLDTSI